MTPDFETFSVSEIISVRLNVWQHIYIIQWHTQNPVKYLQKLFCENGYWFSVHNHFRKKALLQILGSNIQSDRINSRCEESCKKASSQINDRVLTYFRPVSCSAKQMTGFYMKRNTGLKWVKYNSMNIKITQRLLFYAASFV